ncbi:MAG TPA: hypothetical protein VGK88_07230 [bacterium]
MTGRIPPQALEAKRARADALREVIAGDLQSLRREAGGLIGRGRRGAAFSIPSRGIPGWALAAAAGAVAGIMAALRGRAKPRSDGTS